MMRLFALLLGCCSCMIWAADAPTLAELQQQQRFEIKTWLSSGEQSFALDEVPQVMVSQQLLLNIEVATPTWFSGGTQLGTVAVPNAIALQRKTNATNYTERQRGETWSRQLWSLTIYPQQAGLITVPAVAVKVQIANDGNKVAGTVYSQPLQFTAVSPDNTDQPWVVAKSVDLSESWQQSDNDQLRIGDAISRTITVTANDTLAMLMPDLNPVVELEQLSGYAAPVEMSDSATRGQYQSRKSETVTYILQQGGVVSFPAVSLRWWDYHNQRWDTLHLPAKEIEVGHTVASFIRAYGPWFLFAVAALILVLVLVRRLVRAYQSERLPNVLLYIGAQLQRDEQRIRTLWYRQLRQRQHALESSEVVSESQRPGWQRWLQKPRSWVNNTYWWLKIGSSKRGQTE